MTTINELPLGEKLFLEGEEYRDLFQEIMPFLLGSSFPIDLVGPPGSGKSHFGVSLATEYVKEMNKRGHNFKAAYVPMDRETTKSGLIIGYRMDEGSFKASPSVVGEILRDGGACFIDEISHALRGVPLMFNTALDQKAKVGVGDLMIAGSPHARFIFAHNRVESAGNIPLPPTFASRLFAFYLGYPSAVTEGKITKRIVINALGGKDIPMPNDGVFRYLVSYMREIRAKHPLLPLSARNVAAVVTYLAYLPKKDNPKIDRAFFGDRARRRRVAARVYNKPETDVADPDLDSPGVQEFFTFVASIGIQKFIDRVLSGMMYHLDVEGVSYADSAAKELIASSVL